MRFYPDIRSRRVATLAGDLAVLGLLLLLVWLALSVHAAVDRLAVLGEGVQETGGAVSRGLGAAADAVDGTPLVGDELAEGLRSAGEASAGNAVELGQRGERDAHELANLLGALTFLVPAGLLVWQFLPARVAQVRRLTSASRVLADPADDERRRLVAMRAAFSLPYGQLLRHTRDPLGDLSSERYDALIAAAFDDAGLRRPELPAQ